MAAPLEAQSAATPRWFSTPGACMTASGKGAFDEYWGISIQDCKSQCEQASGCLGVEYTAFGPSRPAGERSRCEQFKDLPLTHAVPASSAICLVADTPASRASWKSKIDGRAAHDASGNQMMKGRTRQTHSSHRSDCIEVAKRALMDITGMDMRGCELDGADLSKLNMNGVMFDRAELQGANLVEATAVGSTFFKALMANSNFKKAVLSGSSFDAAEMSYADMQFATCSGCTFVGTNMEGAMLASGTFTESNMDNANLAGVVAGSAGFEKASLKGANLRNAALAGARFAEADLAGADFTNAQLTVQGGVVMELQNALNVDKAVGLPSV